MPQLTNNLFRVSSLSLAVLTTVFILVVSLINKVPQPKSFSINDKIGHCVAYFFLAFFWLLFVDNYSKKRLNLLLVALACIFYGIVIEFMQQTLTTTRTASVLDVIANTIGISIAYFLVFVVKSKVKK